MLGACGLGGPAHQPPPSDIAAVVEMTNGLNFSPDEITLPAGGTVEWRNTSFFTHTITVDPARASNPDDVRLPPGAEPFDSGEIPAGEVFRRRFTTPGTYRYVCIPHEGMGMIGTITVEPAA
ncbi:plastocyanin/azurin family copper-binding protein [Rhodospirillaceae bacterium SYSU D60014]|uniref:cupredoxin domain-containing protein n=1 Tax=Virgifigura deserti TaxID=2268457 RepID=UPI0013C47C5D